MSPCTITWNALSLPEWEERFNIIPRASLLQSYDYGRAICAADRMKARWGLIHRNGEEAGLVQILEAGIMNNAIHAIMMDGGPLWFEGYGGIEDTGAFFMTFHQTFPQRFGRRRRLMPNLPDSAEARTILEKTGLRPQNWPGHKTNWLDLTQNTDTLRANMKPRWRQALKKAESAGLSIEDDRKGLHIPWLLKQYQIDKIEKDYEGPSPRLLRFMARSFGEKNRIRLFRALKDGQPVAAVLLFLHGGSATYQIGWTGPEGRTTQAHNLLLWHAIENLKDSGIRDFDLGGLNEDTASGVTKFKTGMGGEIVTLVPGYR